MDNLLNLITYGQSYWLDNLTREKINSGELKKRVVTEGLRGVTTNPSIFNNAISNSSDYDSQMAKLFFENKSIQEVYEELTIKDVQDACDIMRPVYDESDGVDGFVSLEVSPLLAHNTNDTMKEARRLIKKVDRANCFIKIPGTEEGIPAIEEMLYEGININVTLLFTIQSYQAVAEAYISALERRVAEGKPIRQIRSVASFFLSRIDVLADHLISQLAMSDKKGSVIPNSEYLYGKAAIANAKLAYVAFNKIFSGDKWKILTEAGAYVQRPLWASTGAKDPKYSDVKYVEPLVGLNTVNTLPDGTIAAFADHGSAVKDAILENMEDAEKILIDLSKLGININDVGQQLLDEGIKKFQTDYNKLLSNLIEKRKKILPV